MSGSETRKRLVEAARKLFWEQGYASTGIAQILAEANANSGSLYHFFPTKEDLLLEVLETYKGMLRPFVLGPAFERVRDPIERVFAVLHGYRQGLLASEFAGGCPIGNLALELSDALPAARAVVAENFMLWKDAIRACLEEAKGRLPADADPARLASFVLTVMEGAVMQARAHRSIEPFDDAVSELRDHFERVLADGTSWSRPRRGRQAPGNGNEKGEP